ncbi:MAG: SAM-dependent DNA methyltransferase, partial [Candidatus Marinimicrobia bacterium]|nr:SAM-dependent DNA methyltransferase [Candidatus Neomarinimicrobiota bacterium]
MSEFVEIQKNFGESERSWTVDVADVNTDTFDLSVKNPNTPEEAPLRSPKDILDEMERLDGETKTILESIKELI